MSEQMMSVIQGVEVPVFVINSVVIPLKAIEGSVGNHEYSNASVSGTTYTFTDKDLDLPGQPETKVTFEFNPNSTEAPE